MSVVWLLVFACDRSGVSVAPPPAPVRDITVEQPEPVQPVATWEPEPAPARLVAIGDVHGDWDAAQRALQLAGVLDTSGHWSGGATVAVQVGDQLDRGDQEQQLLDAFERLSVEARAAGGAFWPLLGNHEAMNVALDLRYVTPGGFADFADTPHQPDDPRLAGLPAEQRGRGAAFVPGGLYARMLAGHRVVLQVGDTVFVHGGVLPEHVRYGLGKINAETSAWMRGEAGEPAILDGSSSPIWSRHYSDAADAQDCALLHEALRLLSARRMVVAHTVQEGGINGACAGEVWRVDVGLSRHYGGASQALEIVGETVRVLGPP